MKAILLGGLGVLGIWALRDLTLLLLDNKSYEYLIQVLVDQITHGRVTGTTSLAWLTAEIALKAALGLALLAGIGLSLTNREEQGLRLLFFVLLLFLSVVNLLEFYFEQFSTIVPATIQFLLLLLLIHYRRRFMLRGAADSLPSEKAA
jgi:CHASE2 domain-containing sensor protein